MKDFDEPIAFKQACPEEEKRVLNTRIPEGRSQHE
jgi:hypothetical protein